MEGHRRTLSRPSPDLSPARAFQERRWFTTHRRCYLPRWHSGMGRQAGSSRVCPAPGLTAPPARVDGSDLLIRRYLYRRPDPSRSVRDLGLVFPVVQAGPDHPKVVHPRGSQRGSQPHAPRARLMVFKRVRDSLFAASPTWAFGMTVFYVTQGHTVYIPQGTTSG